MARAISTALSGVLEQLELEGDLVVTRQTLRDAMANAGLGPASEEQVRSVAYRLKRAGWLGSLRTRNAWEFLPAARAGAYRAGDRFMEVRAYTATHPDWPGVLAMDSAATLHGLAQRFPELEVFALPKGSTPPKAFDREWRAITTALPTAGATVIDGLRVWTVEELLVGIAERPTSYGDPAGLVQWLPEATTRADITLVTALLTGQPQPVRQRAAYLFGCVGDDESRDLILDGAENLLSVWFGSRSRPGRYDTATGVNDTLLHSYVEVGGCA